MVTWRLKCSRKHPTCEELGIHPDVMWADYLYVERNWAGARPEWAKRVGVAIEASRMSLDRRERIRILETELQASRSANRLLQGHESAERVMLEGLSPIQDRVKVLEEALGGLISSASETSLVLGDLLELEAIPSMIHSRGSSVDIALASSLIRATAVLKVTP